MHCNNKNASRLAGPFFASMLMAGCAAVDTVSPRVVTFNQQAADAGSKAILTNIMRAAYAEPLQFTNLSSANGQGQISGNVSAGIPFPFRGGNGLPLPQQYIAGNFSSQANAANSFTMSNQNTQEFYQGIQAPLSQQAIFSLMSEGYDPRIILTIFVSDIILTKDGHAEVVRNDPDTPSEWNNFYSAVNKLVAAGFDGERVSDVTQIGPSMSASAVRDPRIFSALLTAPSGAPTLDSADGAFRLIKRDASYRACFRSQQSSIVLAYYGYPNPDPQQTLTLNAGDRCGASAPDRALPNKGVKVQFRTRSIKGAILYLGSLVRAELGLGGGASHQLVVPHSDGSTFDVFRVHAGISAGTWLRVFYHGQAYSLAGDPGGSSDGSSRVMQLLSDVLALQSSSKDAPSTSIITVL